MSHPKLDRNRKLVMLRRSDPKKWTIEALRKRFKLKTKSTVHELLQVWGDKF